VHWRALLFVHIIISSRTVLYQATYSILYNWISFLLNKISVSVGLPAVYSLFTNLVVFLPFYLPTYLSVYCISINYHVFLCRLKYPSTCIPITLYLSFYLSTCQSTSVPCNILLCLPKYQSTYL